MKDIRVAIRTRYIKGTTKNYLGPSSAVISKPQTVEPCQAITALKNRVFCKFGRVEIKPKEQNPAKIHWFTNQKQQ